jgi:anaerobic selenocysteine-containing dehydrogenase
MFVGAQIGRPDLRPDEHPDVPVKHVELGRELERGRFGAAFVWCHDPAVTLPDSLSFRRGFARKDLFTVVHEHFLTETAELADVVLPATMFVEHDDVYRSYGHRTMQLGRKAVEPPSGPRSNVETFAAIAKRLGLPRETWDVTDAGLCDTLIEASRARFDDGELARLRAGEPVKLHDREHDGWGTPSGKIELVSTSAAARGQPAMATFVPDDAAGGQGEFWLVGAPSVHTHNSTYVHSARHQKKNGPPRLFMNPIDARNHGQHDGKLVRVTNELATLTLPVEVDPSMPRGLVRVDGLPRAADIREKCGLNALTSGAVSDLGDGNVMYSARVDLVRAEPVIPVR